MSAKNILKAIPLSTFNSANLALGTWKPINSGGLPQACTMLRIVSLSDVGMGISYDGITEHDYLPPGWVLSIPLQQNAIPTNMIAKMKKGTRIYVKGLAGVGNVYLSGYYLPE